MSWTLRCIRFFQRLLGDSRPARWLVALRVVRVVRWFHDRRILRRGIYAARIAAEDLRFRVLSPTELWHIDAVWREEEMLRRILGTLRPGDVFYDVGANIGIFSLRVARARERGEIRVHAFEPEPRNLRALGENAALNGLDSIVIHPLALGAESGEARLFVGSSRGDGCHSILPKEDSRHDSLLVELSTMDEVVAAGAPAPDVVKIDVEGAELQVLSGMERLLGSGAVRDVFVEVHATLLAGAGASAEDVHGKLRGFGYERIWIHRRGTEWHEHYRRAAER